MLNPQSQHLMFIVYDGIENSVFQSQVLNPLLQQLAQDVSLEITLVSFEVIQIPPEKVMRLVPAHDRLHLVMLRRTRFVGRISLWFGVIQLYTLMNKLPCHHMVTRGPLAGWIAMHTLRTLKLKRLKKENPAPIPTLKIQARGLCAEEFRYVHTKNRSSFFYGIAYYLIYRLLWFVEREVFGGGIINDVSIEVISPGLKEYMVKNFGTDPQKIVLATRDIPQPVMPALVTQWRAQVRRHLNINADAYVYCYSGSYKPWQCADETIQFFVQQQMLNPQAFLLILSQDKETFIRALGRYGVPSSHYRVASISPRYLLEYLSAADAGLLLREPDVINWVSRPTKALEYQAVGLKIIHNNTVAWLVQKE
ncbi:MAG: hypothetical protein WCW33_01965 [Candidatus Babeliales bacterium]|jgi:hypothetical protein